MVELDAGRAVDVQRAPLGVAERVAVERVGLDHQPIELAVQRPLPRRAGRAFHLARAHCWAAALGSGSGAKNGVDT